MEHFSGLVRVALAGLAALSLTVDARAADFDRDVRPILSDRCFTCHGPDASQRPTALRFDDKAGAFVELSSGGRAIVPGRPEESKLLERVASDDPVRRMPPAYAGHDKLTEAEIGVLREWIAGGAEWSGHWSFRTPVRPSPPTVAQKEWPRNAIDSFVLRRLEEEKLRPSPQASKERLIRRAALDLTGLPPTPEAVNAFLADESDDAYEKVVDRLLSSPAYGERLAYSWLDAARYADTNGYQSDGVRSMWRWRDWVIDAFNRNMPFNEFTIWQIAGDLLPNATREQRIATAFHRNHRSNAEGGIIEEEFRVEYVADRAETTAKVWLGLTVGCARCHDHKFDAISQKDYYSLFAFFNNTPDRGLVYNFGNEKPFIEAPTPDNERRLVELETALADVEKQWQTMQPELATLREEWESKVGNSARKDWAVERGLAGEYLFERAKGLKAAGCGEGERCSIELTEGKTGRAVALNGQRYVDGGDVARFNMEDPFTFSFWVRPESASGALVSREEDASEGEGYGIYLRDGKLWMHITRRWTDISLRLETVGSVSLGEWTHIAVSYDGNRLGKGVEIYFNGKRQTKHILMDELTYPYAARDPFRVGAGGGPENRLRGRIDELRIYDRALSEREATSLAVTETPAAIAQMPQGERSAAQQAKLEMAFLASKAPKRFRLAEGSVIVARARRDDYRKRIPTVMVMEELPEPRTAYVLRRGAYDAPGDEVAPAALSALPPLDPDQPRNRLGLARWLVDPKNPLTARVTVNRFWQMMFGAGLVKTPQDFGVQGERPSHPELLDWLAVEFIESGWDVKALFKQMAMSATYRQSSRMSTESIERDPENRLLARGSRYRLPAQTIRDQALFASGLLTAKVGGPSVKPYQPPGLWKELSGTVYKADQGEALYRRSLYTYWKRTVAPPTMVNFDASDRENCSVEIARTNTPLQALDLMNDVLYVEAARKLAERALREAGPSEAERLAYAFLAALARRPDGTEARMLAAALQQFQERFAKDGRAAADFVRVGESSIDRSFDKKELAAYTAVAGLILNLDEAVTKE